MTAPGSAIGQGGDSAQATSLAARLLVRPEEAATLLQIGRTTMYDLLATGVIRSVTIGRCRRVPVEELQRYVARLLGEEESTGPHPSGEGVATARYDSDEAQRSYRRLGSPESPGHFSGSRSTEVRRDEHLGA